MKNYVLIVIQNTKQYKLIARFVPINASRRGVENKDMMILSRNVSVAGMITQLINTAEENIVQKYVPTEQSQDCHNYAVVKSIKYIGKQDVYNMEVKKHHCFSVNGGLIVHNCVDAIRYAMESEMRLLRGAYSTSNMRLIK